MEDRLLEVSQEGLEEDFLLDHRWALMDLRQDLEGRRLQWVLEVHHHLQDSVDVSISYSNPELLFELTPIFDQPDLPSLLAEVHHLSPLTVWEVLPLVVSSFPRTAGGILLHVPPQFYSFYLCANP